MLCRLIAADEGGEVVVRGEDPPVVGELFTVPTIVERDKWPGSCYRVQILCALGNSPFRGRQIPSFSARPASG